MNENDNPVAIGIQLILDTLSAIAQDAMMWRHVSEAYFLGEGNAEQLYREALIISDGLDDGKE
jgi:hypothetical protein